jgi:hypothetical protein
MRLKPADVAILLERLRGDHPSEVEALTSHIESLGTEDALLSLVREMIESKEQSRAAEEATAKVLESWRPIMVAVEQALTRMAAEESRRNDLKERELNRLDKLDEQKGENRNLALQHVVIPIVSAICSAALTAAAFFWSGGG